jgi:hypothetical protein
MLGTTAGFYLAAELPPLLGAAVLFLTPVMFFISTARNSLLLSDRLAFALGLLLAPALTFAKVEPALLIAAIVAGTVGYGAHRLREARR